MSEKCGLGFVRAIPLGVSLAVRALRSSRVTVALVAAGIRALGPVTGVRPAWGGRSTPRALCPELITGDACARSAPWCGADGLQPRTAHRRAAELRRLGWP